MIDANDIHAAFDAIPHMPTTEALKVVGVDAESVRDYVIAVFNYDGAEAGRFCSGLVVGIAVERQRRGESAQVDPRGEVASVDTARIGCPLCLDRIEPGDDVATLHDHPEARMHAECLDEHGVDHARAIIHQERPNQ